MDQNAHKNPLLTELVKGAPLPVDGKELVPLVRVRSQVQRRAALRGDSIEGNGYGFVRMRPIAVLDKGEIRGRHEIHDETARIVKWLALAALLVPWLAMLLVHLSRRWGDKPS